MKTAKEHGLLHEPLGAEFIGVLIALCLFLWLVIFTFQPTAPVLLQDVRFLLVFGGIVPVFAALLFIRNRLEEHKTSWTTCSHAVRGGSARNLCGQCVDERADKLAENERQIELKRRENELIERSQYVQHDEISRLSKTVLPPLKSLRDMLPRHFEVMIGEMYKRLGYSVSLTPISNDHGRDGILRKDGKVFLFECKRYRSGATSGRPDLQKFHSAIMTDKADGGFFVTTGDFSRAARDFARNCEPRIGLVDSVALMKLLHESYDGKVEPETYSTVCPTCGKFASHDLRRPATALCEDGHGVLPSIAMEDVLAHIGQLYRPDCPRCGRVMRIVSTHRGRFWGCSGYPNCKSTIRISDRREEPKHPIL